VCGILFHGLLLCGGVCGGYAERARLGGYDYHAGLVKVALTHGH
jgi:hypothetical protein